MMGSRRPSLVTAADTTRVPSARSGGRRCRQFRRQRPLRGTHVGVGSQVAVAGVHGRTALAGVGVPLFRPLDACANASFDDGIRIDTQLMPIGGDGAPVKPPVYEGGAYQQDKRMAGPTLTCGTTWHTDIEHQSIPLHVSMFLVHKVPVSRDAPGGTWVPDPQLDGLPKHPYFEDSDPELMRLRRALALNGETAYADTAAAFAALPSAERARLSSIRVRRQSYAENEGAVVPLVRTNPRSGVESLHGPLWCPRPPLQLPLEVEGMSAEASRAFLEEIEAHVLQPEFRYDHAHAPGDVTLWDLFMTIHVAPPIKENIQSIDDARLLYRISCKGEPTLTLPRRDSPEWIEEHIFLGYTTPGEVIEAR